MNSTNKKHSILLRGLILVMAFALSILCFPVDGLLAFAADDQLGETDYHYMTIKQITDKNTTVVNKGATYKIRDAFIGKNDNWKIGDANLAGKDMGKATLVSSDVKVAYNGNSVDVDEEGNFVAANEGTYVVTYSYTYDVDGEKYTNSYDLEVQSVLSSTSINFADNSKIFMPSVYDLTLAKDSAGNYKDLHIPVPEVLDKNGDALENVQITTDKEAALKGKGNWVLMSATGGKQGGEVKLTPVVEKQNEGEEDETEVVVGAYISGKYFAAQETAEGEEGSVNYALYGAGPYTVKFSYYTDGSFVTSTTKTTDVREEKSSTTEAYYDNYKLVLELASSWVDNGETGVEKALPAAIGKTSADTTPASEKVDVYYTVEVLYSANGSTSAYAALSAEQVGEYNKDSKDAGGEDIFVASEEKDNSGKPLHYYLADPSKFKPLHDGSYTFIYTISDIYGNTVSSAKGAYQYEKIKDEQKPTPVIYDAALTEKNDADHKLASQTPANSVLVYAIGIDDNVSKAGQEGVELSRKVMTSETVSKFTIDGYDAYNLVFNYRQTTPFQEDEEEGTEQDFTGRAFTNLLSNNYEIRKAVEKFEAASADNKIDTDAKMLSFLKGRNTLIVIDNGNIEHIFNLFKTTTQDETTTTSFMGLEGVSDKDSLKTWLQNASEEDIAKLGFAYLNVDQTFGASSSVENGMGNGYYYIHYIAKDAAGNETDLSRRMQIGVEYDTELPVIKFPSTLQSAYVPSSTITFDVPTATDTQDSRMVVRTMYRYFKNGEVLPVAEKSKEDLKELREDLTGKMSNGKYLTEQYAAYLEGDADGYIELTDADASSYSIDLSEAKEADKLQIVVFVYDDAGNANIYAQTVDISFANDKLAPSLVDISKTETKFEQGARIDIPTMTVRDDAIGYMGFDVKVVYNADKDTKIEVAPTGAYADRKVLSLSGAGEMNVYGGSFVAGWAGDYQVIMTVKDGSGNQIVAFTNYTVSPRIIIQSPTISTTLPKTQTLELDDFDLDGTIDIPSPTVTYDIPRSVTYDVFKDNEKYADKTSDEYASTDYVVYGVDKDGKVLNPNTTFGQKNSLKPRELGVGEYDLAYSVDLLVYNFKEFNYVEMAYNETSKEYEGGYLTPVNKEDLHIVAEEGKFVLTSTYGTFDIVLEGEDVVAYVDNVPVERFSQVGASEEECKEWFAKIKLNRLTSETYSIKIQDTKGPKIADYDYVSSYSKTEFEAVKNSFLQGIKATDASGIDVEKSYITLSWRLANGVSNSVEVKGQKAFADKPEYTISNTNVDGTYKVTYTVYDKAGRSSTKEYSIAVGDTIAPTMKFKDKFVATSYEVGHELEIDLSSSSITITDNNKLPENTLPKVVLRNTSTGEEVKEKEVSNATETKKFYDLSVAGTYTLTVTVEDAVGNTTTRDFTFEVSAKTQDTASVYKVVGTVLIVVSVLVLAGVIVYFIVSKVKLDKELKK